MSDNIIFNDCFLVVGSSVSMSLLSDEPNFARRDYKFFDGDLGMYLIMDAVDVSKYKDVKDMPMFGEHWDVSIVEGTKGYPYFLSSVQVESDWDEMITIEFLPLAFQGEEAKGGRVAITFPKDKFDLCEIGKVFMVGGLYSFNMKRHKGFVVDVPEKKDPLAEILGGK